MEYHVLDLSDPESWVKLAEKLVGSPVDNILLAGYHKVQEDLQDLVGMLEGIRNATRHHPAPETSKVLKHLNGTQIEVAIAHVFDAYEAVLAAVDPAGNSELAEAQVSAHAMMQEHRSQVLG